MKTQISGPRQVDYADNGDYMRNWKVSGVLHAKKTMSNGLQIMRVIR